jgi:hypothetical protein
MLVLATLVATAGMTGVGMASAHAAPSTKKFCDVNWKVSTLLNSIPDEPTPAQTTKIETRLSALLEDAKAVVPTEIEPQVTAAVEVFGQGLEAAFQDPTLQQYGSEIDAWAADNCNYQVVDVTATDYHFDGIPKNLDAGRTLFVLTNEGAELHELIVARIKTKTPLKKLLADEKRGEKETEFTGITFAAQGEKGYAYMTLEQGRNVAACFVPVGSVDPNVEVDGPPHVAEGMVQEFKVS